MRLSDKISGSLSSKYDNAILAALNESCEEKKELKEETLPGEKIVWDNYEDYSEEEIEQINDILQNMDLVAIKHEGNKDQGYSVAIKDNNSGMVFWIDYQKDGQDIYGEFNQYIFHTDNSDDRIRQAIQTSYYESRGDTVAFEDMETTGMQYLLDKGLVKFVGDDAIFESSLNETKEESIKQTLNETDATPEFLEDLKNLINNHMRADKIASMELQEDNETGNEIVVITFENGGIVRENVTGDSNLAMARAILFRLA